MTSECSTIPTFSSTSTISFRGCRGSCLTVLHWWSRGGATRKTLMERKLTQMMSNRDNTLHLIKKNLQNGNSWLGGYASHTDTWIWIYCRLCEPVLWVPQTGWWVTCDMGVTCTWTLIDSHQMGFFNFSKLPQKVSTLMEKIESSTDMLNDIKVNLIKTQK